MGGGLRLPGYLRLLLLLYREGGVEVGERRRYGFDLNDVGMLESYGFVRVAEGMVILSDKGRQWVEENVIDVLFPGYSKQFKEEEE